MKKTLRQLGLNPRALGTNPRALRGWVKKPKRVYAAPDERRRKVPAKMRFEVLKRDGFRCRYCGTGSADAPLHADHVVPWSKGGTTTKDNLVTACADCNHGKGATLVCEAAE